MRMPTDGDIMDFGAAAPGTSFGGFDDKFLRRMRRSGYLDEENRRTSPIERLKYLYRTQGVALFLGAGVSKASGIPDWRGLLDRLLAGTAMAAPPAIGGERKSLSRLLEYDAHIPLTTQFDLIAHGCVGPDRSAMFTALLKEKLYGDHAFDEVRSLLDGIPEENEEKARYDWPRLQEALKRNATLAAIGDLLVDGEGAHARVNPHIRGVLTTNVDNLLQMYAMSKARGRRLLDTVNYPASDEKLGRISVYHLHGWLDMRSNRLRTVPKPPLVFKETEYLNAIANPNSFANHTAQYFFQRRTVVFLGSSLEDLNVRRWLYNAFEERKNELQRFLEQDDPGYGGAKAEAYVASIRHFWLNRDTDLPEPREFVKSALADTMRHLGVQAMWYRDHAEVPELLGSLDAPAKRAPSPRPSPKGEGVL